MDDRDAHLRVMLDEEEAHAAAAANAGPFEELWWGRRLVGVLVHLRRVRKDDLADLLADAWRRRAPKRLVREYEANQG